MDSLISNLSVAIEGAGIINVFTAVTRDVDTPINSSISKILDIFNTELALVGTLTNNYDNAPYTTPV